MMVLSKAEQGVQSMLNRIAEVGRIYHMEIYIHKSRIQKSDQNEYYRKEISAGIAYTKATFTKKLTIKPYLELRKKQLKCCERNKQICMDRNVNPMKRTIWRSNLKIRNELQKNGKERSILDSAIKGKANWIGQILGRDCLLQYKEKIESLTEM